MLNALAILVFYLIGPLGLAAFRRAFDPQPGDGELW